jgi:type VI secretion system secreted protein Hcp
MAVDMFLKFTPELKGEAQDEKEKDTIDVLAWSWGVENTGTTHMGSGSGAGKASFKNVTITKFVDKSSPLLMQACALGKHFKEARLLCRRAGGKQNEYLTILMKDVMVTTYKTGGSGGEDVLTENVELNFGAFEYKYTPQLASGEPGPDIPFNYDIAAQKET